MADAQLSASAEEVLTDGTSSKNLSAVAIEAITDSSGVPSKQLSGVANETVTDGSPQQRLSAVSIEVLTPAQLVTAFIGWGVPI